MNKTYRTTMLLPIAALLATMFLHALTAKAQELPFTMTVHSEPYAPLSEYQFGFEALNFAPNVIKGTGTDVVPLFDFAGYRMDTIAIDQRGLIGIHTVGMGWTGQISVLPVDWIPRRDLVPNDRSSDIGITMEGLTGSRIMKIEWKNMTLATDDPLNGLDSANFQLWLYEEIDMIEIRVGPSGIASPFTDYEMAVSGPSLGLIEAPSPFIPNPRGLFYTNDPGNPDENFWRLGLSFGYLDGFPEEGTVYRFTASTSGISHDRDLVDGVVAAPNPARSSTEIRFAIDEAAEGELIVHDALGVERMRRPLGRLEPGDRSVRLSTEELAAGIYFTTVMIGEKRVATTIVVE